MHIKTLKLLATAAVLFGLQTASGLAQGAAGLSNMPNDAYANYPAMYGRAPLHRAPLTHN
jgi:hypothetical protein